MKSFKLIRTEDLTGVSGTGVVAEGVVFGDGMAVMRWKTRYNSLAIYPSVEELEAIHGHEGRTRVEFDEAIQ